MLALAVVELQKRGIGMRAAQIHSTEREIHAHLPGAAEAVGDARVIRRHAQQPGDQRAIRTVSMARERKGAVQQNFGAFRRTAEQTAAHQPDAHRARGM